MAFLNFKEQKVRGRNDDTHAKTQDAEYIVGISEAVSLSVPIEILSVQSPPTCVSSKTKWGRAVAFSLLLSQVR